MAHLMGTSRISAKSNAGRKREPSCIGGSHVPKRSGVRSGTPSGSAKGIGTSSLAGSRVGL